MDGQDADANCVTQFVGRQPDERTRIAKTPRDSARRFLYIFVPNLSSTTVTLMALERKAESSRNDGKFRSPPDSGPPNLLKNLPTVPSRPRQFVTNCRNELSPNLHLANLLPNCKQLANMWVCCTSERRLKIHRSLPVVRFTPLPSPRILSRIFPASVAHFFSAASTSSA